MGGRRAVALGLALAAAMLASYGVVVALDVPLLGDEHPSLGAAGVGAAVGGVALLTVDAVVPMPSSGVMIALGAMFGVAGGAALALTGSLLAALVGWWIGRRGGPLARRLTRRASRRSDAGVDPAARRNGTGLVVIIASRPIPVVAETVAIVAGAAGVPARRLALGATLGSLPPALTYGAVGAAASDADVALPVVLAVMALSAAAWLVAVRRRRGRSVRPELEVTPALDEGPLAG